MSKKEDKCQINQLTDLYNDWGDKNNLQPLGSADEELFRDDISNDQRKWLEEFINSWDMAMDLDRYIYDQKKQIKEKKHETRRSR